MQSAGSSISSAHTPAIYGFVSWAHSKEVHYAPLATFGTRVVSSTSGRIVCVDPPMADAPLNNARDLQGAIAVVERGKCTFPSKARRVQEAGAIGMIVANHESDFPTAAFTMGEIVEGEAVGIGIPCVMLSFENIRALLLYEHRSPKACASINILNAQDAAIAASKEQLSKSQNPMGTLDTGDVVDSEKISGPWTKFITDGTSKVLNYMAKSADHHMKNSASTHTNGMCLSDNDTVEQVDEDETGDMNSFAFLRWPFAADGYHLHYAPLADFGCQVLGIFPLHGNLVLCDPPLANVDLIRNSSEIRGNIVLVERGTCTFPEKIERMQKIGAKAVIVANNDLENPNAAFVMSVDHLSVDHIRIPSIMISYKIAEKLKACAPRTVSIFNLTGASTSVLLNKDENEIYSLATEPPIFHGMPPLHHASRKREVEIVKDLLRMDSTGAKELAVDALQMTPLHHACLGGCEEIVELLLDVDRERIRRYASRKNKLSRAVDMQDLGGQTALHYACIVGRSSVVEKLIDAKADGRIRNVGLQTPLHIACSIGQSDIMEKLIAANASIDDSAEWSSSCSETYVFHGINDTDLDDRSPLHHACLNGHLDCALYLLAANAQLDAFDRAGFTPLHYLCKYLNSAVVSQDSALVMDVVRVISKLQNYGARMLPSSEGLLPVDYIHTKYIRQEIEVLYLRKEVLRLTAQTESSAHELQRVQQSLEAYASEHSTLQYEIQTSKLQRETLQNSLQSQSQQIEQLQTQMSVLLKHVKNQPKVEYLPLRSTSAHETCATRTEHSATYNKDTWKAVLRDGQGSVRSRRAEMDESELAEEAALFRDIAKKHIREGQYETAREYLDTSLEYYSLPGVKNLLSKVKAKLEATDREREQAELRVRREKTKEMLIDEYTERMDQLRIPRSAVDTIHAEVSKMNILEESSQEYQNTRDWIEWLLSLPWDETHSLSVLLQHSHVRQNLSTSAPPTSDANTLDNAEHDTQSASSLFEQVQQLHEEEKIQREASKMNEAALRIQRFVHSKMSAKPRLCSKQTVQYEEERALCTEIDPSMDYSAVNSPPKASVVNSDEESTEDEDKVDNQPPPPACVDPCTSTITNIDDVNEEQVDLLCDVDSFAPRKLLCGVAFRGIKLAQPPSVTSQDGGERFHILQVIFVEEENRFYVWNRWGKGKNVTKKRDLGPHVLSPPAHKSLSQSAIKGPYDLEGAMKEFERKYREKTMNSWAVSREDFHLSKRSYKPVFWKMNEIRERESMLRKKFNMCCDPTEDEDDENNVTTTAGILDSDEMMIHEDMRSDGLPLGDPSWTDELSDQLFS